MAAGGKTIYFGDLGRNSRTLLNYFKGSGARPCEERENPAEYILEVIGSKNSGRDWHQIWKSSPEREANGTKDSGTAGRSSGVSGVGPTN